MAYHRDAKITSSDTASSASSSDDQCCNATNKNIPGCQKVAIGCFEFERKKNRYQVLCVVCAGWYVEEENLIPNNQDTCEMQIAANNAFDVWKKFKESDE